MNAIELKGKIVEKKISVATISDLMNIHESSLYRKINGCEELTVHDVMRLKEILDLTNDEASDIFLSKG